MTNAAIQVGHVEQLNGLMTMILIICYDLHGHKISIQQNTVGRLCFLEECCSSLQYNSRDLWNLH